MIEIWSFRHLIRNDENSLWEKWEKKNIVNPFAKEQTRKIVLDIWWVLSLNKEKNMVDT